MTKQKGNPHGLGVLEYFLAIANEENITKTAKQLHITQPTLSRQLAMLERELVVKLFQRGNKSLTLTEEGHLLRRRAQEMLELAARTEERADSQQKRSGRTYCCRRRRTAGYQKIFRPPPCFPTDPSKSFFQLLHFFY